MAPVLYGEVELIRLVKAARELAASRKRSSQTLFTKRLLVRGRQNTIGDEQQATFMT